MKFYLFPLLALASALQAADPAVGTLPDGKRYLKHEIDFALKENVARELSPAGAARRVVPKARLLELHRAVRDVDGGHSSAKRWLRGEALPERVRVNGQEVPRSARSLKALLHEGEDAAVVVQELRKHPDVEWASLNRLRRPSLTPNDPRWDDQWGPARVRADDAWDVPAVSTRRVAVIDTGVDHLHPDLAPRIVYSQGFGGNASGDARRDRRGGSSIDHGTHVAGTAAAIRNNIGVAGIATANIMAMGCATWSADDGQYLICCSADAINDAVDNGADVINCSYGNSDLEGSESSALTHAEDEGVVVVVAAGNDGMNVDDSPSHGWNDHSWPLIVSATREDDTLRASSNFGTAIDLAAPGEGILSTVTTNYNMFNANGQYANMSGTSMASPHVAGGIAMVRGMNPSMIGASGSKHFLYRMAEDLGAFGEDNSYGRGLLQLDPAFLRPLRDADAFVNPVYPNLFNTGTYSSPFNNVADAVAAVPNGGTVVLNGGTITPASFSYASPITISKPCVLTALPDKPAFIGQ